MNNPKSMVLGWGSLIAVAGMSFYFAKQSINERRRQQDITGRQRIARDEAKTPQGPTEDKMVDSSSTDGSRRHDPT